MKIFDIMIIMDEEYKNIFFMNSQPQFYISTRNSLT